MRKQMLGTIIALLAVVLMAGAQTPGTEATTRASLQKVAVVPGADGISVEMTAKGAVTPKVETLSSPARIVVDLPNAAVATSMKRIQVGNNGVNAVRIGTDASATTRVVVDMDRLCKYELVPGPAGKVTLKLYSAAVAQVAGVPAKSTAAVTAATAAAPAEHKPGLTKAAANEFVVAGCANMSARVANSSAPNANFGLGFGATVAPAGDCATAALAFPSHGARHPSNAFKVPG